MTIIFINIFILSNETGGYRLKSRAFNIIKNFIVRKPAFITNNILLTYHCTQKCLQCNIPFMQSDPAFMKEEVFKKIVDRLESTGSQIITLSGGEPALHPQLDDFIAYAKTKSFKRVHLLTNLYGPDELIDKTIDLIFKNHCSLSTSFDGFGDVADDIRQAQQVSNTVMKNIDKINERNKHLKQPIKTFINIVISQKNLHQIKEIIEYVEKIGWNFNIDIYRFSSKSHRENESMKLAEYKQIKELIDHVKKSPNLKTPFWLYDGYEAYLKDDFKKICPYLNSPTFGSKFFIQPNGDVKVCIGDPIGNLYTQSPEDIFKSEKWKQKQSEFKACKGCWNSCYTLNASIKPYFNLKVLRQMKRL